MTAKALRRALDGLGDLLFDAGLAVDRCAVVVELIDGGTRVTWQSANPAVFELAGLTLDDYMLCVDQRQYTFLLHDGSFLQISYQLDGAELRGHRLVYWPSPFADLDLADYPCDGAADVIREYRDDVLMDAGRIQLRSPWRFDFDPKKATKEHPESHLTALHSECRLPLSRPLDLRRFSVLVFRHLFSRPVFACQEWSDAVPTVPAASQLRNVDDGYLHVHWRTGY